MTLSVIIPAYNRGHLIGETLNSLICQDLPADEIIVVDDGSTDDTATVAASYGKKIVVIRQENRGPAAARNAGFAVSTGEYVHFFDSDDIALPNKQRVQVRALEASGADIAYCPWVKGTFSARMFNPENQVLQQRGLPKADLVKALLTDWSIVPHACIFRRSIVEKCGGFPEHLFIVEDQLMFLQALLNGARVVHTPETLELYRTGNSCKLTAAGEAQKRHLINWGRFLLDAEAACLAFEIDPKQWFGFRLRVWEALEDLHYHNVSDKSLELELLRILGDGMPPFFYRWHRQIKRWRGGIQSRFAGGRAEPSFRIGPLTETQKELLDVAGYRLQTN